MNSMDLLIFLIVALALAAIAAGLFLQAGDSVAEADISDFQTAQPSIIQITGHNISNETINYIRIQVTSETPVSINDTTIILTEDDTATLRYRDGTLTRNISGGFYTQ